MSVFYIVGKPRGGKTFLGTKFAYDVVLMNPKDTRPIVTNLPLHLDVMAAELKSDLKLDYTPELHPRVRILDDAETGEFYLFDVGREYEKRKKIKMRSWTFDVPDFEDRGHRGCVYIIDEVHIYFPATFGSQRDSDDDLRFFMTQHGKMNIDVILITQHPDQVAKSLRRLAQEFMTVRNLSREPYLGFRLGNLFRYIRSLNSPTSANPAPFESGFHQMDFAKYGKMFDTTKGVGIAGSLIRETEKRGRSLWWLTVPAVLFVVFLIWFVFFAPHEVLRLTRSLSNKASSSLMGSAGLTNHTSVGEMVSGFMGVPRTVASSVEKVASGGVAGVERVVEKNRSVYCTGFFRWADGEIWVFLSDGTQARSDYGEVGRVTPRSVVVNGKTYSIVLATNVSSSYREPEHVQSVEVESGASARWTHGNVEVQ